MLALCLGMVACEEKAPFIDLSVPTNNLPAEVVSLESEIATPQEKKVLMEEFSGVKCVNCPDGAAEIASIKAALGEEKVVSVTLHTTNLAEPIAGSSTQDFRTPEASTLLSYFNVFGLPAVVIDRFKFDDIFDIALYQNAPWQPYVESRLAVATPINVSINESGYEADSAAIWAQVQIDFTQAVSEDVKLSVYLTEDNITDAQEFPGEVIDVNYVHRHVVRAMLTPAQGVLLVGSNAEKPAGQRVIRNLRIKNVSSAWNLDNCEIVAVVHGSSDNKTAFQVAKAHLEH
ncbi:MAG: Omp28-related outer membrane protein [Sphingobacteriales bacterium]|nr:Omp28-related outer membrane protein [Sphingobacteriales bacterium]